MSESFPADSVGLVKPQLFRHDGPLTLRSGAVLPGFELVYETYGKLNAARSNAILVCHALSGDHHAAGFHDAEDRKPGWWDSAIGPGKPIDTNRFFVVSCNNLGGCQGSTGPLSPKPDGSGLYGPDFPIVTVRDWVKSQALLGAHLGVQRWAATIGGSLGAMQVIRWTIDHPQAVAHALVIAAAPKLSAQNIAFNEIARQAIISDPEFHGGRYIEHGTRPRRGLALARMLGHVTYLSDEAMRARFGRLLKEGQPSFSFDADFEVERYLRYQGESFVERFDANTYLLMTKALDYFDPARDFDDDLSRCFAATNARFLVLSFTKDWRFAPERSREIVKALVKVGKNVSYAEIESQVGHDDFLLTQPDYVRTLRSYLERAALEVGA